MDGAKVVCIAHTWLGTPYVHQASLKGVGSDCLGLVRGVWREVEGSEPQPVPSYSSTWSELDGAETLLRAAKRHFVEVEPSAAGAGDVLIFRLRSRSACKTCRHCQRRWPVHSRLSGKWRGGEPT